MSIQADLTRHRIVTITHLDYFTYIYIAPTFIYMLYIMRDILYYNKRLKLHFNPFLIVVNYVLIDWKPSKASSLTSENGDPSYFKHTRRLPGKYCYSEINRSVEWANSAISIKIKINRVHWIRIIPTHSRVIGMFSAPRLKKWKQINENKREDTRQSFSGNHV